MAQQINNTVADNIGSAQFLNSLNVKVFPSTLRNTFDPSARLTTEYNLCSIINRLVDQESFVISSNIEDTIFYFNIHGYIFSVKSSEINKSAFEIIKEKTNWIASSQPGSNSVIYAHIFVKYDHSPGLDIDNIDNYQKTWAQLQGDDGKIDNSKFIKTGVNPNEAIYTGLLLSDSSDPIVLKTEWQINTSSVHYCLPLFEVYGGSGQDLLWRIVPDSQIKFKTGTEYLTADKYKYYRSVTIDDGVL